MKNMRASVNIGDFKSPSSAPADCKSAGTGEWMKGVLNEIKKFTLIAAIDVFYADKEEFMVE